jgi:hypothetical protein
MPPSQPVIDVEIQPREAIEDRALRIAERTGSVLGGTIAGFTTGVARHTVAPVAKQAAGAAKTTFSFIKMVLLFVFIAVMSVIGLFVIIVASAPRR